MATSITALVVQKGGSEFINSATSVGLSTQIPVPTSGGSIDADYWAIPINDGQYTSWNFQPYNPANPAESVAPTVDSFAVFRLSCTNSSDWWYVIGTSAQYITAANGGTALPTAFPYVINTKAKLSVCATLSSENPTSGLYETTIGVPTLGASEKYYAFGNFNGVALAALSTAGYTTTALLLTAMNTNWGTACGGTFTKTSDDLTFILTQSAGDGNDIFCGRIIGINPSL